MGALAVAAYDPAAVVTKSTTAALTLTALDTTNLRRTFTAPPSGIVIARLRGVLHGATTFPQILFGVLEGAAIRGRAAPTPNVSNAAATSLCVVEAFIPIAGLTPGQSYTYDAAYGVETAVAATALKYGGPNDGTANNAFGAFLFEIWAG